MGGRKIILFMKVFCILLVLGFVLPFLLKLFIVKFHFLNNQIPSGNSVFVMHRGLGEEKLVDVFCNILQKFTGFYRK